MPYRRAMSPLTTWHSQNGLLLVSLFWGLSYLMPISYRIPFSEVFPDRIAAAVLPAMWMWGLFMLVPAAVALLGDEVLKKRHGHSTWSWRLAMYGHVALSGVFTTLAFLALIQGLEEIHGWPHWRFFAAGISALSRPVLWGLIAYYHTTYARLPRPVVIREPEEPFNVSP